MDERLKFIARLLDGEKMAGLCREFGISRKTGYKILTRYNEMRPGRADRSLAPALSACQPAALPDRDADRALQAGQAQLGRAEDQGAAGPALSGRPHPGDQHGACGSRSPRPGHGADATAQQGDRNSALASRPAQ